jgi:hypothetical protein
MAIPIVFLEMSKSVAQRFALGGTEAHDRFLNFGDGTHGGRIKRSAVRKLKRPMFSALVLVFLLAAVNAVRRRV